MADNKVAAGRKMLMEFQKKKTEKKHLPTSDSNSGPNITESQSKISLEMENPGHTEQTVRDFIQVNQLPPDNFFDKFSNLHQNNEGNISYQSDIPLAGSLFASQSDFEITNNINKKGELSSPNNNLNPDDAFFNETNQRQHKVTNPIESEETQDLKTLVEISKLQQQLEFHVKTVEFLVTEKNNLTDNLQESEKVINDLKMQVTDLTGRLNTSRHRVSHLESENNQLKIKYETAESQILKLANDLTNLHSIENTYKKQLQDVKDELQEMKTLMDDKVSDYKLLLKKYEETNIQLQSNELRLQQVIQGNPNASQDVSLQEHCQQLEQIVNTLRQQLSHMEFEKNDSNLHYQQYVQQLNNQVQTLNEKQEELIAENERLQTREESLLQQMGSLEKQLQTTFVQNIPRETSEKNNSNDTEKIKVLEMEISQLKIQLENSKIYIEAVSQEMDKRQQNIDELTSNIQRMESESPDVTKLNAAIESDRLAAQKATAQNAKMKEDLHHLEKAFEQMTHSKLELAELLQVEKNSSKSLTMKLVETEEKLKEVETKLMAKDEEMIRLQAASSELEKEILKHAQITDRINHYEAQGKSLEILQTELQTARNTIQTLTSLNEKLKKSDTLNDDEQGENVTDALLEKVDSSELNGNYNQPKADVIVKNICTSDAMQKLEEKFTKLMKEVADLSDEKQKLEHIVLQLQGETETICEYIALYQKQRNLLKQREMERNAQLNLLSTERENMKRQLEDVKALVAKLSNNKDDLQITETEKETSTIIPKIMDLLAEIKSNQLVESNNIYSDLENFHHCAWCSGKLITV